MKRSIWYGIGTLLLAGAYPARPAHAQSLTGVWQGVEGGTSKADDYWPAVLRVQKSKSNDLFGVLYQEVGDNPAISVTFRMRGRPTATGMQLDHGYKLSETGRTSTNIWCAGSITFTYDAKLEKLTGHATYRPDGDCEVGTFTLYRIKLKSAATVRANTVNTLAVSGRNVLWFADANLKQPVTTGNTYRTKLSKTTTFYLKQAYYLTDQSPVVPITISVAKLKHAKSPRPVAPRPVSPRPVSPRPFPPRPVSPRPDTTSPASQFPPPPLLAPAPVALPTVLFRLGTAELLPGANPALDQLAAELKARPAVRVRVAGHTDRVGEPDKNQLLSEQRAAAVKSYLEKAGVAPERIDTIGYGDSRPVYASPDARNRRVEVEEVK